MQKLGCVLLIDDSEADNFIHTRRLNKMNLADDIVVRTNGQEGIRYFTEEDAVARPDILFLDINMPVMDGWEFLDRYQQLPAEQRARLTVLMIASSVSDGDHERANGYTCIDSRQTKPLTREKVRELLEEHFPDCLPD